MRRGLIAVAVAATLAPPLAAAGERVPCAVRLQFLPTAEGPAVAYLLTAQVKNPTLRPAEAVSLLMFDAEGALIGNSDAGCTGAGWPLLGGDTGECGRVLQEVTSAMLGAFGAEVWTRIVNDQLDRLQRISTCEIVGFRFAQ